MVGWGVPGSMANACGFTASLASLKETRQAEGPCPKRQTQHLHFPFCLLFLGTCLVIFYLFGADSTAEVNPLPPPPVTGEDCTQDLCIFLDAQSK